MQVLHGGGGSAGGGDSCCSLLPSKKGEMAYLGYDSANAAKGIFMVKGVWYV
jgi:hypothetical protein